MKNMGAAALLVISLSACGGSAGPDQAAATLKPGYYPVFPPLADGQTTFVVTPELATGINAGVLRFPDHARFSVDPRVTSINWTAQTMQLGADGIFDLSPSLTKPSTPPQPPTEPQADYCATGHQGAQARRGADGQHGVDLTIGVDTIDFNGGFLWIRTDGGPSGNSGMSGNGQQGGGHYGGLGGNPDLGGCHEKDGGDPGPLANPGEPGRASVVSIRNLIGRTLPECAGMTQVSDNVAVQKSTKPPPISSPNSGLIFIYGSVGCRGYPGPYGLKGRRG